MDFKELFRSFFNIPSGENCHPPQCPDHGISSSDNNEEEETFLPDDARPSHTNPRTFSKEFPFFFGGAASGLDGMFEHFHTDMHQQMESLHHQMEEMMKSFGAVASDHWPPMDRIFDNPSDGSIDEGKTIWTLPGPDTRQPAVRDFLLKEDGNKESAVSVPSAPDSQPNDFSFFRKPMHLFPWNRQKPNEQKDTDLDGKVSSADVMELIKKPDREAKQGGAKEANPGFFFGKSVTVTTVRGSDGKLTHTRVERDSSGQEQVTETRTVDGQTHTITTVKSHDGKEERREDFTNMDEKDVHAFEEKWKRPQTFRQPTIAPFLSPDDKSLFSRFFGDR